MELGACFRACRRLYFTALAGTIFFAVSLCADARKAPQPVPLPSSPQHFAQLSPQRGQLDPATLPAHESHQGLQIAVRPDSSADASKARFGKNAPYTSGILGLDVYFRNDNDMPIRINLKAVRLFVGEPGGDRAKLEWISHEEVADRILLKTARDPTLHRTTPLPRAGLTGKGKDWDQLDGLLRAAAMSSELLPAHSTVHGYFYFDIDHQFELLSNALLDVPELAFASDDRALFFFQIDLAPAARP